MTSQEAQEQARQKARRQATAHCQALADQAAHLESTLQWSKHIDVDALRMTFDTAKKRLEMIEQLMRTMTAGE